MVVSPSTYISKPQVLISAHKRIETWTGSVLPEQSCAIQSSRDRKEIHAISQLHLRCLLTSPRKHNERCVYCDALALSSHLCHLVLTHPQPFFPHLPSPPLGCRSTAITRIPTQHHPNQTPAPRFCRHRGQACRNTPVPIQCRMVTNGLLLCFLRAKLAL